jgi:hypothetical protein
MTFAAPLSIILFKSSFNFRKIVESSFLKRRELAWPCMNIFYDLLQKSFIGSDGYLK